MKIFSFEIFWDKKGKSNGWGENERKTDENRMDHFMEFSVEFYVFMFTYYFSSLKTDYNKYTNETTKNY